MTPQLVAHMVEWMHGSAVIYADSAARAELAPWVDQLSRPETNAGAERLRYIAPRSVWRAKAGGKTYLIKQFHSTNLWHRLGELIAGPESRRELRRSERLRKRGVPVVAVLAAGADGTTAWTISRSEESACPLESWHDDLLARPERPDRKAERLVMDRLADLLARMHDAGVRSGDLRTAAFQIAGPPENPDLALVDLHRVGFTFGVGRGDRARDLAKLMHDRLHATNRTQRLRFLRRYLQASHAGGTLRGWAVMVEHFAKARAKSVLAEQDRRILRANKYFASLSLPNHWKAHVLLTGKRLPEPTALHDAAFAADQWRAALADPRALLVAPDAEVVKDEDSSLIVRRRLRIGSRDVDVYIKRTRRMSHFKGLADMLRRGRSIRAFLLGHMLLHRRIPTATPLAAMERRVGPLLLDGVLITETVQPAERLNRFVEAWLGRDATRQRGIDSENQRRLARDLLVQLGRLLRRLHHAGFAHRDLKASNVLVSWRRCGPPQVVMIDLDGLSRRRSVSRRRRFQGLMRLNVSLLECTSVNHAGRLRMLLGYLRRPGSGRINFKPYWRELERWSSRKLGQQIASRRRRQKRRRQ